MTPIAPETPEPSQMLRAIAWVYAVASALYAVVVGIVMYNAMQAGESVGPGGFALAVGVLLQGILVFALLSAIVSAIEDLRAMRNSLARMETSTVPQASKVGRP